MAGYQDDYSKSNNAVAAENSGRYPASKIAEILGVKIGAVKALCHSSEWHHTSKFYNSTEYYDLESAQEILAELKAWVEPARAVAAWENCSGEYLEWGGTRNHPRAKEIKFTSAAVTRKGDWFTISIPGQAPFRKKKDTRGFCVRDAAGKTLNLW